LLLAAWSLLLSLCFPVSAEVIDGIVATVNGAAILSSDVDQAIRCENLLEGRPPAEPTPEQRRDELQRLIDQELLRQQMGKAFPAPRPEEVAERIRQVRAQIPGAGTDDGWRAALARYRLTEAAVSERLAAQMQITRFIELRLQPDVAVDPASVQAYYHDKLLPELRQRGVKSEPPLDEVSPGIEQVLRQERVDEMLASWLRELRQQGRINMKGQEDAATQGPAGKEAGQVGK
jgi:hypothetical protein